MVVDVEQPLLEKKRPALVYPNCPGCKNSYLQDADAKLPWKVLAIMAALSLVNTLPSSSLYPFLYFMVRDFNVAKIDKDIGFYVGYIGWDTFASIVNFIDECWLPRHVIEATSGAALVEIVSLLLDEFQLRDKIVA